MNLVMGRFGDLPTLSPILIAMDQQLFTERLELRRLAPEDAEEVFYVYASRPEVGRYVTWPTHRRIEDTREFLTYVEYGWRSKSEFTYGIRQRTTNRLIGALGARHDDGRYEIGYVLGPSYWNHGYATEACAAWVGYLKSLPRCYRIQSFVDAENVASARVLLKSGFVQEAYLSKWRRFINQGNVPKDCIQFWLPM